MQVNLNNAGRWLVGLLYFKRDISTSEFDLAGDRIIKELLPQLKTLVKSNPYLEHFTWLRYSQGGNHLRLQFWVTSESQLTSLEQEIRTCVDNYIQANPDFFHGEMRLTPMMERLREKAQDQELHAPGTFLFGPAFNTGEESVYESEQCFHAVQSILSLDSAFCQTILSRIDDYRERALVSHLFALSTLALLIKSCTDKTALGMYVMQTWTTLFGIRKQDIGDRLKYYQENWSYFSELLDNSVAQISEVEALDPQVGSQFAEIVDQIERILTNTPLNSQSWETLAMQALTIMHQNYNRLGISMLDEISFAAFIYQQHASYDSTDLPLAQLQAQNAIVYWEKARV